MSNLFIVGNGFDLAHKLETSYNDFQNYLISSYELTYKDIENARIPFNKMGYDGSYDYDRRDIAMLIVKLISETEENWNELEDSLGEISYAELLDDIVDSIPNDKDGDFEQWKGVAAMEDYSHVLQEAVSVVHHLFSEWVATISYEKCKCIFGTNVKSYLEKSDHILSFNYTPTIERIYKRNVFHIHGKLGTELEFGHGDPDRDFSLYDSKYLFGSKDNLRSLHAALHKDTNNILCRHQQYFDNLCSLENVYSYGFSYNKIDKIYIEEIINKHTNSNTNWHLNLYQQGEYEEQYNVLEDLGFIGKIIPLDLKK